MKTNLTCRAGQYHKASLLTSPELYISLKRLSVSSATEDQKVSIEAGCELHPLNSILLHNVDFECHSPR